MVLGCMSVIMLLSSQNGAKSSELSGATTDIVVDVIVPDTSVDEIEKEEYNKLHIGIRELAHFGEYFVFAGLVFWALYEFFKIKWSFILTLPISLSLASLDELNQTRIPGRYGSVSDVITDFSGSFTCFVLLTVLVIIIYFINKRKVDSNAY